MRHYLDQLKVLKFYSRKELWMERNGKELIMAAKIMEVTRTLVNQDKLTTLMITHNMRDAIEYADRRIMMYEGRIAPDIRGEEKQKLTVEDLLAKFGQATCTSEVSDNLLLS